MYKSPNNIHFESNQGRGDFIFKGRIKGERVEATSLSAPELDSIASQLEDIRARIRALSSTTTTPPTTTTQPQQTGVDVVAQIQEMREQLRSADLPGLLAQMDEIRTSRTVTVTTPSPPVPQISIQQLTRLQDQVTRLVGQLNTLQDRVSILEGRARFENASSSSSPSTVVDAISDVAGSVAGSVASAVVNRAALKLEDMVSPGALYNLRKVSDRGPVRYAW